MIFVNYRSCIHTHTQFCDGRSTMAEIARRAAELGYVSLGFSPHSPLPYENDWAMRADAYPAFLAEIAHLKKEYEGRMQICAGIEWDADTPELPENPDYVIGAVHSLEKNGERFSVDYTEDLLKDVTNRLYGGDFLALCADYFEAVSSAALRPQVQIVAHFDLVTKYNKDGAFVREDDQEYLRAAKKALDAIFERRDDLYFEVNTGVMARAGKKDPYPGPALLRYIAQCGGKFIVTCDCHRASQLGVGYDRALELLSELPSPRVFLFENAGFQPFSL